MAFGTPAKRKLAALKGGGSTPATLWDDFPPPPPEPTVDTGPSPFPADYIDTGAAQLERDLSYLREQQRLAAEATATARTWEEQQAALTRQYQAEEAIKERQFEAQQSALARENQMRMTRLSEAGALARTAAQVKQRAMELLGETLGRDPFRGAALAAGILPRGITPVETYRANLAGTAQAPTPQLGAGSSLGQIEGAIGQLQGQQQLPLQPAFGLAGGGRAMPGGRQVRQGGTGVGVLVGDGAGVIPGVTEVMEVNRDGVRVIPLAGSAQGGLPSGLAERQQQARSRADQLRGLGSIGNLFELPSFRVPPELFPEGQPGGPFYGMPIGAVGPALGTSEPAYAPLRGMEALRAEINAWMAAQTSPGKAPGEKVNPYWRANPLNLPPSEYSRLTSGFAEGGEVDWSALLEPRRQRTLAASQEHEEYLSALAQRRAEASSRQQSYLSALAQRRAAAAAPGATPPPAPTPSPTPSPTPAPSPSPAPTPTNPEDLALQSTLARMYGALGFSEVPRYQRTTTGLVPQGAPASQFPEQLGFRPRLLGSDNQYFWADPEGVRHPLTGDQLTQFGFRMSDVFRPGMSEIEAMYPNQGSALTGAPPIIEEGIGDRRYPALAAPIVSPVGNYALAAPRMLASVWGKLDPITQRTIESALSAAGFDEEYQAAERAFFTPQGSASRPQTAFFG